jgi:hypothetical protein
MIPDENATLCPTSPPGGVSVNLNCQLQARIIRAGYENLAGAKLDAGTASKPFSIIIMPDARLDLFGFIYLLFT